MIIKRKSFTTIEPPKAKPFIYGESERANREKAVRKGEALGTAVLGTGGTLAAIGLGEKVAKNIAAGKEGKKAVQAYRSGLRELAAKESASNKAAANNLAGFKKGIEKKWFGKNKEIQAAEEAYKDIVAGNKAAYKTAAKKLRSKVVADRNKAITKAGRKGKLGVLAAGLGATSLLSASKLRKKDNKLNSGEIIK